MAEPVHPVGAVEHRAIEIVAYDPEWPERFQQQRARIAQALGPRAVRIDHIGSTAVPGLVAKGIVDIDEPAVVGLVR